MSSHPVLITAVAWIERGVAAENPQTVKLEPSTIRELIESTNADETTDTDNDNAIEERQRGLRGSSKGDELPNIADPDDKFNMATYDQEKSSGPSMKGLTVFATPTDDPYITSHDNDSEDEHERDSMKIKPTDNMVAVAKFDGEDATLLVYVYNVEAGDFYVHHDYPISAPILCLESIGYDPGVDSKKGNLLAVSTMETSIQIFDLDIINAVQPVVKLGSHAQGSRKKRDGSEQCHTDSVLSLSWNRQADHLLASGGADQLVVLWDLDAAKPAQNLPLFNGMVQTLEWCPASTSVLLSGTRNGEIRLDDGRQEQPLAHWDFAEGKQVEVERVLWDRQNEHNAYSLTSDGKLRYFDTRQAGKTISIVQAYENEEVGGLSLSSIGGLLSTVGGEEAKFWQNSNEQLELIGSKKFHLGRLRCVSFCPDQPNMLLLGGEQEDLIYIYDVAQSPNCVKRFPSLRPSTRVDRADRADRTDNVDKDIEMTDS